MQSKQLNLIYALKEGKIVHISQVDSGLKCGCICPSCKATLIARKGEKTKHHFAHYKAELCKHGFETSLHMAAKEIISKSKYIWMPAIYLKFFPYKNPELISDAFKVNVDDVTLEKAIDDIIPDIIITSGNKKLIVEIFVTHKIDDEKLKKIKKLGISTLEIDLSNKDTNIEEDEFKNILIEDSSEKHWAFNTVKEDYYNKLMKMCDKREVIKRGFLANHIDYCPMSKRVYKGKPYANLIDDCFYCEFCIIHTQAIREYEGVEAIYCSGKELMTSMRDLKLSHDERKKKYDIAQEQIKADLIASGKCPVCTGKLIERSGKNGNFYGCINYPHCKYTKNIN